MIDDLDRQIIKHLQSDGRMAYSQLGQLVGLSDGAARQRVKRLQSLGVIDIVAITDPRKVGLGYQAMIAVKVDGDTQKVAADLGMLDEAFYVVITAGRFDALVEVVCSDADELLRIADEIRSLDGVSFIEVTPYLAITKETYDWGTG